MQEFTSISVSSYEAGSLADRLTEQSGAGWDVVAIVPTGSTVTAYLSRDAGSAARAATVAGEAAPATEASDAAKRGVGDRVEVEKKPEPAAEGGAEGETAAGGTGKVDTEAESEAESKAESRSPVDEPGGWAIAPEAAKPTPTAESTSRAASTAGAVTPTPASTSASTSATTPTSTTPAGASATPAAGTPAAATAQTTTAQTASAAPAGWYADPSSRYELRYWDGTQWTEHVSRSGQQFTDPPVA